MPRTTTGHARLTRRHLLQMSAACFAGLALPRAGFAAPNTPRRIVTIGADITETVALIDGLTKIVAIDHGSRRPPEVARLPNIGSFRSLSAEGIVAMAPDLIIASAASGPPDVIKQIRDAGFRLETVSAPDTVDGIVAKIISIGDLIDQPVAAARLADRIAAEAAEMKMRLANARSRPKVLFVVGLTSAAPLAAGAIPSISEAIALAGGENAGAVWTSVKPVSREALFGMPLALVLTTSEILNRTGGPDGFLRVAGMSGIASLSADHVMAIDTGPFFLFGPSTLEIATEIARKLHPDLFTI